MSLATTSILTDTTPEDFSTHNFSSIKAGSFSDVTLLYEYESKELRYDLDQLHDELGYAAEAHSAEEINFLELIHPVDIKLFQVLLSGIEDDDLPELNCRIRLFNNEYRTYKLRVRKDIAEDCAVIEAFCLPTADHTVDELVAFRQLKAVTEEVLQYGTFEFDTVNNIGHWSDGMYDLFGYKTERPPVTVQLFTSHLIAVNAEDLVTKMLHQDAEGGSYSQEFDILTNDHAIKRIHVMGKLLNDKQGNTYKRIGIIRDITTQRTQEATITKIIDELQRSNKELEEFAYIASHDLQEPLRKITTFCGRLSDKFAKELNDEGKLYLERVIVSADNMRIFIDNLLEFSRVSRINTGFSEISLSFVLQQVEHEQELSIEETGTTIKANGLPVIRGAFSGMKQVFNNILSNAIKFRKPGVAPVIVINGRELTPHEISDHKLPASAGRYFKISICDNGIGFEAEYAARIFQIFQRLHGRSEYPGSGIGLAICKKIIEHHNGIIWAENIPGMGACFNMILPEYPNKN